MSFLSDKVVFEGLTFDDVLLLPSCSQILPCKEDQENLMLDEFFPVPHIQIVAVDK
jgi:hypothetical protein